MTTKVIVTNVSALKQKYAGKYTTVRAAITKWIAADDARGIRTRLIALDSASAMKRLSGRAVTDAQDEQQNKAAIDAIYAKLRPDYLVILGAADVIPHQDLLNPVYSPPDDPDRQALGDLPYACEAPYSRRINDFIGPTRVVGRVPDLTGATEPTYLLKLIDYAAGWRSQPRRQYERPLAISAEVWEGSTRLTLRNLFRTSTTVRLSPPRGPRWSKRDVARMTHFINCHGAPVSPEFLGQRGTNSYPVSHQAAHIAGKVTRGTIVAVECCYGAELYDPALLPDNQPGIANVYLGGGAYAYFGSTTIAYGDVEFNSAADLLCQYFLAGVLQGASLGRATLEAQQRFARAGTDLDPVDLKTLAQFVLLGDPSVHPVAKTASGQPKKRKQAIVPSDDGTRRDRRVALLRKGLGIPQVQGTAVRAQKAAPRKLVAALEQVARARKLVPSNLLSFAVRQPAVRTAGVRSKAVRAATAPAAAFHVMFTRQQSRAKSRRGAAAPPIAPTVLLVAREVDGEIVSLRELHRR
ncbi:MAG TPA: hypothetical protein VFZ04_11560 [Longimicrobiales bacterium]